MINGDREIQCHQHKTIYGDKENSIISIKKKYWVIWRTKVKMGRSRSRIYSEFSVPLLHSRVSLVRPVEMSVAGTFLCPQRGWQSLVGDSALQPQHCTTHRSRGFLSDSSTLLVNPHCVPKPIQIRGQYHNLQQAALQFVWDTKSHERFPFRALERLKRSSSQLPFTLIIQLEWEGF